MLFNTTFCFRNSNNLALQREIDANLQIASNWFKKKKINLNENKTKKLHFKLFFKKSNFN